MDRPLSSTCCSLQPAGNGFSSEIIQARRGAFLTSPHGVIRQDLGGCSSLLTGRRCLRLGQGASAWGLARVLQALVACSQCRLRPLLVVVSRSPLSEHPRFTERVEHLAVQQLATQLAGEGPDVAILPWARLLNLGRLRPEAFNPAVHHFRHELRPPADHTCAGAPRDEEDGQDVDRVGREELRRH